MRILVAFVACCLCCLCCLCSAQVHPAYADDLESGTVVKDGALYTFQIENGEATITEVQKAPDNAEDTYEALLPEVVSSNGQDGWTALEGVVPDGQSSFLVTAVGPQVAGGRVYDDTPTTKAVEYNDEITRIVIPGMVTSIGDNAFAGCRAAAQVVFDVDHLPNAEGHASHLQSIGDYAFAACSSAQAWELPDSLVRVGTGAFHYGGCDSITRLKLPAAPTAWGSTRVTFSDMPLCTEIEVPEGCVNLPTILVSQVSSIALPSTLRGDVSIMAVSGGATNLGQLTAAEGCAIDSLIVNFGVIDSVVVPEGVKTVSLRGSFSQLELPSSLTSITQIISANLRSVDVPASVRTIGSYAFALCPALESVTFTPFGSLRSIGNCAFRNCKLLSSIELPDSLVLMDAYVFEGCDGLTEVVFPASLTNFVIPFKDCANLRKVSFKALSSMPAPQSIAEGCPALTEVHLPDTAAKLYETCDFLLKDCPALKRVYTDSAAFSFSSSMFPGCGSAFIVYGWGVDGNVLNSCEEAGLAFAPYAELDGSGRSGVANTVVTATAADAVRATCSFTLPLSFNYERVLEEGADYTLESVSRDGLPYLRVVGNGATCFGEVEVPAMQDLAGASVASIGRQVVSGGQAACPRPRITLGGRTLELGADYTLSYSDNDRAGTATVTAAGAGNYTGAVSASFEVTERHELSGGGTSTADRVSAALSAATLPGMPESCDTVVVTWAHDHAAVAAASALAVAKDAQLLVVSNTTGLADEQKAAVQGWGATRALVVGGAAACGAGAVSDLKAAGLAYQEVGASASGASASQSDAADLSLAVVTAGVGTWGTTAVVANPADPALCLAAAAYAGAVRGPLLLTQPDGTLSADAASALTGFTDVVIAGDFASVDAALEGSLPSGATTFRAESPAALVEHGRVVGVYASADVTYTVAAHDASANMPYAASAGRAKAPLIVV